MKNYSLFLGLFLLINFHIIAQPGSLDPTFSDDGILVINSNGRDEARAVAVQADGKILVAGFINGTSTVNTYDMVVYRLNTDGSYDNTFDGDGKVVINPGRNDGVDAMLIQSDGKIVLAGYSGDASNCLGKCYVRLNTDGSLDNTFGTGGWVAYDYGVCSPAVQVMRGLDIDEDGNIYSAGRVSSGSSGSTLWMYKLKPDGSLDNTFDTDGKLYITGDAAFYLALDNNKKSVLSVSGQNGDILRLNANGSLDNTFGNNSYRSFDNAQSNTLYIDNQGKIISAGFALIPNDGVSSGLDIYKLNTDGSFDISFNSTGKKHHTLFVDNTAPTIKNILPSGNFFYLTGHNDCEGCGDICSYPNQLSPCYNITGSGTKDFVIMRLSSSDGSLDQSFSNDGVAVIPVVSNNTEEAFGATLDLNGNIIVVGFTESGGATANRDIAIIRVKGNVATNTTSSKENAQWKLYPNPGNDRYTLNISEDKKIKSISLKNMLGESINIKIEQDGNSFILNLESLSNQIYLLEITDELENQEIIKVIKN